MTTTHIKITSGGYQASDKTVELNGHPLDGVTRIEVAVNPIGLPKVTLDILPGTFEFDGVADVREAGEL